MYIEKTKKIQSFRDIIAWQKSKLLCVAIYQHFRDSRDFGFRDQIQRASVSVMNNIAEGHDRSGDKELVRFLMIARGSCTEVRSMLDLALELNYISQYEYEELESLASDVAQLIAGFARAVSGRRSADGGK